MARTNVALQAFNRGLVDRLGLARTDIDRMRFSAEEQTNWMPRVLGSMMLRPGLEWINGTRSNLLAYHIPFVYSLNDTAILELTNQTMRVLVDEQVVTRPAVSTAVTNGNFNTDLTGWTDDDQIGAVSNWQTGGYLGLTGTTFNAAIRTQLVTVSPGDQNVRHALRIVVTRGNLILRVGSTSGGTEYLGEITLMEGTHSLAFTPTGDFYIQLIGRTLYTTLVDSVNVDASGAMTIPTPWVEADMRKVRWTQSADVIFCACDGYQQIRIERRAVDSWSVVTFLSDDGPFGTTNTSTIRLSPSALNGNITLTASSSYFKSTDVGSLFRITSIGQNVVTQFTGDGQSTGSIRVTGVGTQRTFFVNLVNDAPPLVATITLQRSVGEPGNWVDVVNFGGPGSYTDGLDNQIIYYRYTIKTGNYTSGSGTFTITYSSGGLTGVARVTGYTSPTVVTASVIAPFGATTASDLWNRSEWSNTSGWPSSVALYEGRLWWSGKGRLWGSVSDAYASYDDNVEGSSGPINRAIGEGPVDTINWLLPMQRLILGASMAEWSLRSNSFEEPLTPTNANLKSSSTQGSSDVAACKVDTRGLFVDNSSMKLFEMLFNSDAALDYSSSDLTSLVPDIGRPGIVRIGVQRKPDTRVHCVRADGTVAVMIYDPIEDVKCWIELETTGAVEDIFVLPANGRTEDYVYYAVRRTVNGSTVRFLERWAMEEECRGGTMTKLADSFRAYNGAPTTTISAPHLANTEVVVWADGKDIGNLTLNGSGTATVATPVSQYCVGLYYRARHKTTKLAYGANAGTALTQRKRVAYLGLIMADTHCLGLRYGPDFDTLDDLPRVEDGADVSVDTIYESYDHDAIAINSNWNTDSRMCIEAAAPRPATVLGMVIGMDTNERV